MLFRFASALFLVAGLSLNAAPEGASSSLSVDNIRSSDNHFVLLDFIPTLAGGGNGIGLSYLYRLSGKLGLGPNASFYKSTDKDGILLFDEVDFTSATAGLDLKYFFREFGRGWYGSIGANYSTLDATARGSKFFVNEVQVKDDRERFGYLVQLGYSLSFKRARNFIIDVGLSYGNGNGYSYSADSTGRFEIDSLDNRLGMTLGFGAVF